MKATITKINSKGERDGKYGKEYNFTIEYNGKSAYYTSKKSPQTHFVEGQEAEFTETEQTSGTGNKYWTVKPVTAAGGAKSNYGKALAKEQSKYSGFACSYSKDLVVASKIEHKDLLKYAKEMFDWMVEQDKIFSND